jgi:hypothetical protein
LTKVEDLERRVVALAGETKAIPERVDYDEWRLHRKASFGRPAETWVVRRTPTGEISVGQQRS